MAICFFHRFCCVLLVFLSFSSCFLSKIHHECIHDEFLAPNKVEVLKRNERGERHAPRKMETSDLDWKPIRIETDFSNIMNLKIENPSKYQFIRYELVPALVEYVMDSFEVLPSEKFYPPIDTCVYSNIPQKYLSDGIDADLLMIVDYEQDIYSSYLAYAASCLLDGDRNNRPVVGAITFNAYYLSLESEDWDTSVSVSIHEFIHLLGFSSGLFDFFVDEEGKPKEKSNVVRSETVRNIETNVIVLEEVVEVAKEHFGCDSLEGVELENQGDLSSRGSHWERRILGNEIMTASITVNPVLSGFTLSLLEATGWYHINFTEAEEVFTYGLNTGCSFIEEKCFKNDENGNLKPINSDYFCNPSSSFLYACSADYIFMARCGYTETTQSIDEEMNYFEGRFYGSDTFADNCIYMNPYSNGDCRLDENEFENYKGLKWSPSSRCLMGTLHEPWVDSYYNDIYGEQYVDNYDKELFYAFGCYSVECSVSNSGGVSAKITLSSGETAICQNKGDQVTFSGYNGYLECPDNDILCANLIGSCPSNCSGHGKCLSTGECSCDYGYTAENCAQVELHL